MELLIVRHAQSNFNVGNTQELDSSITEAGQLQAYATGIWLKSGDEKYHPTRDVSEWKGICSPYQRTMQTASILSEVSGLNFQVCPGPREYFVQSFKHKDLADGHFVLPRRPEFPKITYPAEWNTEKRRFPVESLRNFLERISLFLASLKARPHEKFIVVSHGAPCRAMKDLAIGYTIDELVVQYEKYEDELACRVPDETHVSNCSVTYVKDGQLVFNPKVYYDRELFKVC